MLKIKEALKELSEKSYKDIQVETAWKWGSRACASYQLQIESESKKEKLILWTLAEEYFHESIEHAALNDDGGKLLKTIDEAITPHKEKAWKDIEKLFK